MKKGENTFSFGENWKDYLKTLNSVVLALMVSICLLPENTALAAEGWSPNISDAADQSWCYGPNRQLYHGDFNGDGLIDLLCHNSESGRRRIDFARWDLDGFYGTDFDSTRYPDASQHWCTNRGEEIHVGDFNGDGKDDLLCFQSSDGRARIDWANSEGTFFGTDRNHTLNWCNGDGEHLMVADYDGDGRSDLLCHEYRGGFRKIRYASPGGDFNSICLEGATLGDGTLLPLDLHFVVLADPSSPLRSDPGRIPTATSTHTHPLSGRPINQSDDPHSWFRAEVELINSVFHDGSGNQVCIGSDCISYRYRGHTLYENISGSSCEGLRTLANPPSRNWTEDCAQGYCGCSGNAANIGDCACDPNVHTNCDPLPSDPSKGLCVGVFCPFYSYSEALARSVNECHDPELRKPGMVNVYIIDNCRWPLSSTNCGNESLSHGRRNGNTPYVFIDYIRLLRGDAVAPGDRARARGAEQHELGHTLGLGHVCFTDSSGSTNAMHHSTICVGGKGDRAAGFFHDGPVDHAGNPIDQIDRMIDIARRHVKAWSRCDD